MLGNCRAGYRLGKCSRAENDGHQVGLLPLVRSKAEWTAVLSVFPGKSSRSRHEWPSPFFSLGFKKMADLMYFLGRASSWPDKTTIYLVDGQNESVGVESVSRTRRPLPHAQQHQIWHWAIVCAKWWGRRLRWPGWPTSGPRRRPPRWTLRIGSGPWPWTNLSPDRRNPQDAGRPPLQKSTETSARFSSRRRPAWDFHRRRKSTTSCWAWKMRKGIFFL